MASIQSLADRWLALDRDEETIAEIRQLLAKDDTAELESRLRKRITFGTAGLRSSMKAGFAHMNSLNVLTTSTGLADYILQSQPADRSSQHGVVIGYDGRYRSERFARLAAAAFLTKGFKVCWFGRLVHTPLVPFAVQRYTAAAGVMITASHNPKNDNGYKVYWSNGSQIIPPHDAGIARAIENAQEVPSWDAELVESHAGVQNVFEDASAAYFGSIASLIGAPNSASIPDFVYTPMHGVGLPYMQSVVGALNIDSAKMHVVAEQAQPDPGFPTVSFPNPEEKSALDLAIRHAKENNISLIIANDPDADRFSAAAADPSLPENDRIRQFTGNQLGVLLAAHVLETYPGDRARLTMLASTVSTRMLAAMAKHEGFQFRETLTGFKWLGNVAQELQKQGNGHQYDPAFAFEEAIGYMFPRVVWDKDGVTAAAVFLHACARWQQEQGFSSPWEKLRALYARYGYFADANTYVVSPSPATTDTVFAAIRGSSSPPTHLGARRIKRWRDLTVGKDTGTPDGRPALPVDPTSQMITCELEDGVVFTVRGSGTEPKIKFYIEAQDATSFANAEQRAGEVRDDLLREWFVTEKYGLRLAAGV